MTPKWILLALVAMVLAVSGCVYNDDDDNDDGGGGATIDGGGDGDNNDGGDDASGTVNARGSPGWGLIGSIGAVVGVGFLLRRRN